MTEFELTGLEGDNLLAVLAALGTLAALEEAWPDAPPRLSWTAEPPHRAVLTVPADLGRDALLDRLHERLAAQAPAFAFGGRERADIPSAEFAALLTEAAAGPDPLPDPLPNPLPGRLLAALGCEAADGEEPIGHSPLVTMPSAASQQFFLKVMATLAADMAADTGREPLERALFHPWDYADDGRNRTLRWDPADDRAHALRWREPTNDPIRSMAGANRLASTGFAWFPAARSGGRVRIPGHARQEGADTLSWPLWHAPAGPAAVRALLCLPELTQERPRPDRLRPRGVVQVMRARRHQGRQVSFSVAEPLW
ncbi:hypothetical protein HL658_13380 [Azospirillum sp. RWY-5-1]|uniref:Uncharacterized protein n=1 Tax=Azospirillum oleiclasticum TaxID=2735135 RepID=A0ABX2TBS4_9PROT|nr:hypothetical protein [Azospirillum oleiclasticum]NYZ13545.1 hypothetical protein [Azospirillum oleiclasticum]NYZ20706.1 hypothetical protein [Azospirillum oleiclasticum]